MEPGCNLLQGLTDHAKQHSTVLAIGFDAGFNSKTSFNTIFKKCTKPHNIDYLKKLQEESIELILI